MDSGRDTKLSFSLSSKRTNRTLPSRDPSVNGGGDGEPKPLYVTVFDPSQAFGAASTPSIEAIPNADIFRGSKKLKSIDPQSYADDVSTSESKFVLDTSTAAEAPASSASYGLTIRNPNLKPQQMGQEKGGESQQRELRAFQEDIKNLPEDRGQMEFDEISVGDFAATLCKGYGWSAEKGIGRTNRSVVKVVEMDRRKAITGFGSDQASDRDKRSRLDLEPNRDQIFRVIGGKYIGSKGKVVKSRSDDLKSHNTVLKLFESDEIVEVEFNMVAELGSVEEKRCLRKLAELKKLEKEEKGRMSRSEESRQRDSEKGHSNGSRHHVDTNGREESQVPWLRSHIRVKIISKDFRGGKHYLKKGKVVDVISPTTCDISLDGDGELVQGVDQRLLETALPKSGGSVLVLYGKHKGVYGNLVERNMEKDTGVVRDADNHSLVHVKLEQIAEYIGDPGDIGY